LKEVFEQDAGRRTENQTFLRIRGVTRMSKQSACWSGEKLHT
jgi:hypothetical protein